MAIIPRYVHIVWIDLMALTLLDLVNECTARAECNIEDNGDRECIEDFTTFDYVRYCLHVTTESLTFTESLTKCRELGAELIQINHKRMNYANMELNKAVDSSEKMLWIGLQDPHHNGSFMWTLDESPFRKDDFDQFEDSNPEPEAFCVARNVDDWGMWKATNCNNRYRAICQILKLTLPQRPTVYFEGIPPGTTPVELHRGSVYTVRSEGYLGSKGALKVGFLSGNSTTQEVQLIDVNDDRIKYREDAYEQANGFCGKFGFSRLKLTAHDVLNDRRIVCIPYETFYIEKCSHRDIFCARTEEIQVIDPTPPPTVDERTSGMFYLTLFMVLIILALFMLSAKTVYWDKIGEES